MSDIIHFQGEEIRSQDVAEFLVEKSIDDLPCPVCHTDKWELLFSPGEGQYPAWSIVPNVDKGDVLPLFLMVCKNCGYARSFLYLAIANWIKAKRERAEAVAKGDDE